MLDDKTLWDTHCSSGWFDGLLQHSEKFRNISSNFQSVTDATQRLKRANNQNLKWSEYTSWCNMLHMPFLNKEQTQAQRRAEEEEEGKKFDSGKIRELCGTALSKQLRWWCASGCKYSTLKMWEVKWGNSQEWWNYYQLRQKQNNVIWGTWQVRSSRHY